MLYVAYGSNLNLAQMSYRCPNAKIYTPGFLKGWKLIFRGSMNNSHATITESSGSIVPVLVWEITKSDERRLDIYEGFPKYYKKHLITVYTEESSVSAMVYIMNKKYLPGLPSEFYVNTIKEGYEDNNFDLKYLYDALEENRHELLN